MTVKELDEIKRLMETVWANLLAAERNLDEVNDRLDEQAKRLALKDYKARKAVEKLFS